MQAVPPFPLAGEIASLTAAIIWAGTMSIFSRFGARVPSSSLNLYKNLVATFCLTIAAIVLHPDLPRDPWAFVYLAASGIIGLSLGDTALFAALKHLGAQITSASQCLSPPIAAIIAAIFLQERLAPLETVGMMITAGATVAIIHFGRRGGAHLSSLPRRDLAIGLGLALVAAICQSVGVVMARFALQDVHVVYGTMMRIFPAILVLYAGMLAAGGRADLRTVLASRRQGLYLTVAAFGGSFLGLVLMSYGSKYSKAGITAALTSTYPIWIIPIAHFLLKERVSWQSAVCTVIAVAGIITMMLSSL